MSTEAVVRMGSGGGVCVVSLSCVSASDSSSVLILLMFLLSEQLVVCLEEFWLLEAEGLSDQGE